MTLQYDGRKPEPPYPTASEVAATDEEIEYLRRNWEAVKPGGKLFNQLARQHGSILIVLNLLRSQEKSINPSLLVIRECIRELRQYEL